MSDISLKYISLIATVSLAFVGYIATYLNSVRLENRKSRVKFVNDQLQNLYGPLYSLSRTGETAWQAFRSKCRPDGSFFDREPLPDKSELEQWRLWMGQVFMPINLKMEEIIINNVHLIEGDGMPPELENFLSHVEVYKIVIKKWQNDDFSEHTAYINYPDKYNEYISGVFTILRRRQKQLMM